MKFGKTTSHTFAKTCIFIFAFLLLTTASMAQITINLPKMPKLPKIIKSDKIPQEAKKTPSQDAEQTTSQDAQETPAAQKTPSNPNKPKMSGKSKISGGDGDGTGDTSGNNGESLDITTADRVVGEVKEIQEAVESGKILEIGSMSHWYIEAAISAKTRNEYISKWQRDGARPAQVKRVENAYDELAASVKRVVTTFKPPANLLAPTLSKSEGIMIREQLNTVEKDGSFKIYKMGSPGEWEISLDSNENPILRYKDAWVWGKSTSADHPYCKLYAFTVIQDSIGGNAYSKDSYLKDESYHPFYVGCP